MSRRDRGEGDPERAPRPEQQVQGLPLFGGPLDTMKRPKPKPSGRTHSPGLATEHKAAKDSAVVLGQRLTGMRLALAQRGFEGLTKHEADLMLDYVDAQSSRLLFTLRAKGLAVLLDEVREVRGRKAHVCVLKEYVNGRKLAEREEEQ